MIVGVDLGGTKIRAAAVDPVGRLVDGSSREVPTPATGGASGILDAVTGLVRAISDDRGSEVVGVGVAAAGVVERESGTVLSSTATLTGWAGTPVRRELVRRLGRGSVAPVIDVLNDVDAYGEAEAWIGAAARASSAFVVAVGTGVGGAIVVDGRVLPGAHSAAGEIGHIPVPDASDARCPCGRFGHLEAVASGRALERDYERRTGAHLSGVEIARRSASDPHAAACLVDAGRALGRAIAGVVTTLDPAVVVLGGGVAAAGPVWRDAVDSALTAELVEHLSGVPVVTSGLGDASPMIGATRRLFGATA